MIHGAFNTAEIMKIDLKKDGEYVQTTLSDAHHFWECSPRVSDLALLAVYDDYDVDVAVEESNVPSVEFLSGARLTDLEYADNVLLNPSAEDVETIPSKALSYYDDDDLKQRRHIHFFKLDLIFPRSRPVRLYRVISGSLFLEHFASDRRHMRRPNGDWIASPPVYDCLRGAAATDAHTLPHFLDMTLAADESDRSCYGTVLNESLFFAQFV
ncbi:protein N-terminal glutamine amidohydrolase [Paragonimus westermani]|uniref:Protein N-terminal glutamine amidohydrolase n=1 Tax=Paragonimus westermani TaxID=34504 RepID=A0A5J4N831_9TREM|nr:protein N-terminal glutamine amidohydrolase [Paragonimus westermani]